MCVRVYIRAVKFFTVVNHNRMISIFFLRISLQFYFPVRCKQPQLTLLFSIVTLYTQPFT